MNLLRHGQAFVLGCAAFHLAALAPAAGQFPSPDTPLDSPLWWPLADGVTPADLQQARSPEGIRQVYREAVAAGLLPDCGPDVVPASFSGSSRPELMTMGEALMRFAARSVPETGRRRGLESAGAGSKEEPEDSVPAFPGELPEELAQGLEGAGFSPDSFDDLVYLLDTAQKESGRAEREAWPARVAIQQMIDDYIEREDLGPPEKGLQPGSAASARAIREESRERRERRLVKGFAVEEALDEGDALFLSQELGGDRSDWQEWLPKWREDASAEAQLQLLEGLREQLSESDWIALRRYLLATVSSGRSLGLMLVGPCDVDLMSWNPWQSNTERDDDASLDALSSSVCGDGYRLTRYQHLDLDGGVSVIRSLEIPSRPLIRSEEVAGKHYFRNEFLIAERDPATGRYAATASTSREFAAEGARVLNRSSPQELGPETVFLLQGAEHPRTEDWAPPPPATFRDGFRSGRRFAPRAARPTRDEGDGPFGVDDDDPWRFLVRFDVRERGEREAEILWTEDAVEKVEEVWLSTLGNTLELAGNVEDRVVVYALVEVDATVRVGQRVSVMPRCCGGATLCK